MDWYCYCNPCVFGVRCNAQDVILGSRIPSKFVVSFANPILDIHKTTAAALGVSPYYVRDYLQAAKNYGFAGTENALLLLHQYNLKSVGVGSVNSEDGALLKELATKLVW